MMDALLEAAEVAGPQAALASVGVSGGSFGLSNTERLHLEEGTVAGSHRAGGRARAYPDHRGVMVDEDDNIAVDEDVGTAQSNTVAKLKRARAAMRKFCESEFMASRLDLMGYSEDDKEKAREIAERFNQEFSLSAVSRETCSLANLPRRGGRGQRREVGGGPKARLCKLAGAQTDFEA